MRLFKLAALLFSLALATPASADIYLWSQTPSTNTNSDLSDDINWIEGMAPSEVNDSSRAMMSEIRKWVDDQSFINGSSLQVTGGTANAQTLTTNATAFTATHGWNVCFVVGPGLTNTSSVVLNVDGLTSGDAVQARDGSALTGGELAAGSAYCATWDDNDDVWLLENVRQVDGTSISYTSAGVLQREAISGDITCAVGAATCTIDADAVGTSEIDDGTVAAADLVTTVAESLVPAGTIMPFAGTVLPDGYFFAYGQCESTTTYATLYTAFGGTDVYDTAGDCGAGEFKIPDLRGRVIAGHDDMDADGDGGTSANRLTDQSGGLDGDTLGDTGGAETHTLTTAQLASHSHDDGSLSTASHGHGNGSLQVATAINNGSSVVRGNFNVSTNSSNSGPGGGFTYVSDVDPSTVSDLTLNDGTVVGTMSNSAPDVTGTTTSTGSGGAHNNVQPTIVLNYIIKY